MKAFKIKNQYNLFSTGGNNPKWTKRGKTWGSFQALKLHLRQFCSNRKYEVIDGNFRGYDLWENNIDSTWTVIELSEEGLKEYSAKELYKPTEEEP